VEVPPTVSAVLGGRARIPVMGTVNGHLFRGSTMPTGAGGHLLGFTQALRAAAGLKLGDQVTVQLSRDEEERTVDIPDDLARALDEAEMREPFEALSFTRRKELARAVAEAKKAETRARRVQRTVEEVRRRAGTW